MGKLEMSCISGCRCVWDIGQRFLLSEI
jgi:hypothetical protein